MTQTPTPLALAPTASPVPTGRDAGGVRLVDLLRSGLLRVGSPPDGAAQPPAEAAETRLRPALGGRRARRAMMLISKQVNASGGGGVTETGGNGGAMTPEDASRLRVAVMRLARTLRTASAEEDLTPAQSGALSTLDHGGATRVSDLARAEGLNPTMLSRVLAALEERGLARRRPDDGDRRVTWAEVTPAGARLIARLRARRGALLCLYLERLDADDTAALVAALPALERLADVAAADPTGADARRAGRR